MGSFSVGQGCQSAFGRWQRSLRTKMFAAVASAMVLACNGSPDVDAGQTKEQMAEGIAVFLALSLLARSAAESANAEREKDDYNYNEDLEAQENALAACLHRAYRNVTKAGGHSLRLENVEKILEKSGGEYEVVIQITEFYSTGESRETTVRCVVKRDMVTDITS